MPKGRVVWVVAALAAGAAILAVALLMVNRRTVALSGQDGELTGLRDENRDLRAQVDQLAAELRALQGQPGVAAAGPGALSQARKADLPPATLDALRNLGQLREDLASARAAGERWQDRITQLEGEIEKVKDENAVLSTRQRDLEEQAAGAGRLVDAMRAELKGKNDRLAPLELANQAMREENRQSREKLRRLAELSAQLEDVNRRRESYLTNILRRYREITDQYRALNGRGEDRPASQAPGGTEASRIENAVSLAEEDLRQLRNLNAQAERLQRELRRN